MLNALIVEDDILLANRIKETISEQFNTIICNNGLEAIEFLNNQDFDLIISDLILPKVNSIGIIKYLKENNKIIPIIVIANSDIYDDKAEIMNYPMAEYFVYQKSLNDLLINIDHLIQRFNNKQDTSIITYNNLTVDIANESAEFNGTKLENIKGKYLELLYFFVLNNNIILKKEEIFDRVWGVNSETTINAIEVYISGLRKELKKVGCDKYLKTIRGVGYSLS
ncbi:response regulator transcription factor [Gemelliphila palaticanis]|uniref:Response regulator transcription factor n=1 Tax=Gemelliphila palaticanis TaxID=81950 RepID=A0ABX2SZC7_9BACL|nr:response regulator transcription factor [Gemella palaticanis]MBF0715778.1 response regulator transcription factor [Gemella palaticanis]NYS47708.1 response regulator transcription factor [Gemella palaticanis]